MECYICYNKIFIPKTSEEHNELKKRFMKLYKDITGTYKICELIKFKGCIITDKNNPTYKCPTPNCNSIICGNCFIKLTHNGKDLIDITDDDLPDWNDIIVCPYCREKDWKYYMKNNVLDQLQRQILKNDEYENLKLDQYKL